MTRSTGRRRFHFKNRLPRLPGVTPWGEWSPANRGFYADFRQWLRDAGYSDSALSIYGVAARLALGWLDKPYWQIDPERDLDRVREYLTAHFPSQATRESYGTGLAKLAEYLRLRCQRPAPPQHIHWDYYLDGLPAWLTETVRAFVAHRQRAWGAEQQHKATGDLLSQLTRPLRWLAAHATLSDLTDLTPALWFAYVDVRLASGIKPVTLNGELGCLQHLIRFVAEQGRPVCERLLRVEPFDPGDHLPRDVPIEHLHRLLREIETDAASSHAGIRRMGVMDRAWFLLMLHSGLRTGEVRRLRLGDVELEGRRARIEQSKGLKDRIVYLSPATIAALGVYLDVRGPAGSEHVFVYRHQPLSPSYCYERLRTYGERCGMRVTPHQLRHSCATLLLNAGAPILTVQMLLGHKHIDTTLGYARLYDGTVAADYYRAMAQVEPHLALGEPATPAPHPAQLLAYVDALRSGTLNEAQVETLQALRAGLLAWMTQEASVA